MCIKMKSPFPISLLLAPPAGVDAAALGSHEVLAGEDCGVVQAATVGVQVKWGRVHRGRIQGPT